MSFNMSPVWTPNSDSLFFVSGRGGTRVIFELAVSDKGTAVGEPRRVTTGVNALTVNLSMDARHLAYSVFLPKNSLFSIQLPDPIDIPDPWVFPEFLPMQTLMTRAVSIADAKPVTKE